MTPAIHLQRAIVANLHARIAALKAKGKGPGDLPAELKRENTKLIEMETAAERRSKRAA